MQLFTVHPRLYDSIRLRKGYTCLFIKMLFMRDVTKSVITILVILFGLLFYLLLF